MEKYWDLYCIKGHCKLPRLLISVSKHLFHFVIYYRYCHFCHILKQFSTIFIITGEWKNCILLHVSLKNYRFVQCWWKQWGSVPATRGTCISMMWGNNRQSEGWTTKRLYSTDSYTAWMITVIITSQSYLVILLPTQN